ncbi:NAD-binding protein [Domibacillus aminovorans]|uniref:NAD-binding protein n=1 Tax=Domibacillus aminovorans TaxID=29332 RepID=UPI003CC7D552
MLIGWSEKVKAAVQEIIKFDQTIDIVVIDNAEKAPAAEDDVFYIRGDATNEEVLLRANLPKAKGIFIFAKEIVQANYTIKDPLLVDGKTLLVATAITLMEEKMNTPVYVIAEVTSHKHIQLFKDVKIDEFIPTKGVGYCTIVQSLFPA